MTTHSFGPGSPAPSNSYSGSPAWSHSYSIAALRAGVIALVLLAVLAVIVLANSRQPGIRGIYPITASFSLARAIMEQG
jgi:hypothetical protein